MSRTLYENNDTGLWIGASKDAAGWPQFELRVRDDVHVVMHARYFEMLRTSIVGVYEPLTAAFTDPRVTRALKRALQ